MQKLVIFIFTLLPISTLISQERTVLDVWWEVEHPTTLAPGQTLAQKIDGIFNSKKESDTKALWMEHVLRARMQEKDPECLKIMNDETLIEKFTEHDPTLKGNSKKQIDVALLLRTPGIKKWFSRKIKMDDTFCVTACAQLADLSWFDSYNQKVIFLIDVGIPLNEKHKYNWQVPEGTALMATARSGALKNYHSLIAAHANVLITDSKGLGAIDYANDKYCRKDADRKEIVGSLQILTMKALAKQPSLYWSVLPNDICSMLLNYICKRIQSLD